MMKESFWCCDLWDRILGSSVDLTENKILDTVGVSIF